MKFFKILFFFSLILVDACTVNNLDPQVDCSISTLDFSFTVIPANCGQNNGSVTITASGGNPPYIFAIGEPAVVTTNTIENLEAGNYIIIITDNVKCSISKTISVASKGGFQATALVTPSGCKTANGAISVQPVNGVSPYTYKIGSTSQTDATFNNLASGQHEVLITDATGCDFSLIETVLTGVSYASIIKPIINNSCAVTGCHNGSQFPDLRTYNGVKANTKNIREFTQSGFMPKDGSLTPEEKDVIACWVDDGAIDN